MKPQPFLVVDHATALGGAEHSLLLLLKHLDRSHWEPHLASVAGGLQAEASAAGIAVHTLPLPRLRRSPRFLVDWLWGVRALSSLARLIKARFIYANTVRAAFYAAPAARLIHRPFVWHMRDFWLSETRPPHVWADTLGKRLLCMAATRVMANSQAVAAHLPWPSQVTLVHNGIDVTQFDVALDGSSFRQAYGIPLSAPLIGMIGRLRPWKGQACFLRLAAHIAQVAPEARFVIVGGTPLAEGDEYRPQLGRLVAELNLTRHVTFTGHLADVRPALAALDIFVHPGEPEPFGLVNVEAMAMQRPVVAFAHGALPEIVVHEETGLLVAPGDETALAEAVLTLVQAPGRRVDMGILGQARVMTHFTIGRVVQEVSAVFKEVGSGEW
jgi:glycosyltransferase involved in cell wall biosynthesis